MALVDRSGRRAELVEAAARAIRKLGPSASMEEMAREAGITKPILYRHFGDKAGLCRAIAERFAAELADELGVGASLDPEPPSRMASAIDAYLAFAERDAAVHRFLSLQTGLAAREVAGVFDDFCGRLAAQMADNFRARLVAAGRDASAAEPWAHAVIGMVDAAASWWLETRTMSRRQLGDHLVALIWHGYGAVVEGARGART
jgi:AcrR family transcriptional regulator